MARLIDADKLTEKLLHFACRLEDWNRPEQSEAVRAVAKGIKLEKTVDAVEVVRCGACRFYEKDTVSCTFVTADTNWYEEDFCSYGERRTDGKVD